MSRNGPAADSPVVFRIRRESECSECGAPLERGSLLCLEQDRPLCLDCADLGHLEYLPRGDAALTRRARKHSGLAVVVVEFNRSRRRYERQGVLVEPEAVDRARAECLSDADLRAARRERDAVRRAELDRADARFEVRDKVDEILDRWRESPRPDSAR